MTPRLAQQLLALRGKHIEQVQPEHQKLLAQTQYFILADGDEAGFGLGGKGMGVTLVIAEDGLGLQRIGSRQLLDYGIAVVVGTSLHLNGARQQEIQVC